ncbi:MAG: PPC domain-containing protein [Anaerolineae bacterium]
MSSRWKKSTILIAFVFIMLLSGQIIFAQDNSGRILTPGIAVEGTLNASSIAQVYTFSGSANQSVTISATHETVTQLSLLLTDSTGNSLGQSTNDSEGVTATISSVVLPSNGTYYVTVLPTSGISDQEITYSLSFDTEVAGSANAQFTPPSELLTVTGMQIALTWDTTSNLDLEVRDPIGGSLYWETPSVSSGGQFEGNVNGACNNLSSDAPTEQASWPAGVIPTGSYELIVYYQQQQDCPNSNPANLKLSATVDGKSISPIEGTVQPDQVFIASIRVAPNGDVTVGKSGVKIDPPSAVGLELGNPIALSADTPASGSITSSNPYATYSFSGQTGQVVSLQLNASSGSLDTLLMLLDPNGNLVASNDDREQGVTNSAITNFSLILSGEYTVIAARYGQALGGTEGEYTLVLSGIQSTSTSTEQSAQVPVFTNLPSGSVEVSLQWSTGADIQLLVRDPQGASVYDDKPQIPSGGTLASNGNNNCQVTESGSPLSYIYWPAGRLPTAGPYEIEVLYQNACNDSRPVTFSLNVVANGSLVVSKNEVLALDERYVVSFNIGLDGQITAGEGGIFGTKQRPDVASILAEAITQATSAPSLVTDQTVSGSIRLNHKFDVYVFDATAGQVATIGMEQLNGTLDTVLFLIGPGGDQITQNDDASSDTRNSIINNFPLPVDGRYIVIATHFGGRYGVTSGDYRLTLRLN